LTSPADRVGVVAVEAPPIRQLRRAERQNRVCRKRRKRGNMYYQFPVHFLVTSQILHFCIFQIGSTIRRLFWYNTWRKAN
jgi:hypothetical protein